MSTFNESIMNKSFPSQTDKPEERNFIKENKFSYNTDTQRSVMSKKETEVFKKWFIGNFTCSCSSQT